MRHKRFLLLPLIVLWLSLQLMGMYRLTMNSSNGSLSYSSSDSFHLSLKRQYTSVHCVGENFLESSWQYKSCHYRNLYWNGGEWTIRASSAQLQLDQHFLWSSSKLQQNISTIGLRPAWIRSKQYRWSPKLIKGIPQSKSNKLDKVVLVLSVPPSQSAFGMFIDTLLPLYNVVNMFRLQNEKPISVHILNSHELSDQTHSLHQGLSFLGYHPFEPPPSNSSMDQYISHVVAGIGRLTGTGLSKRGYATDDYQTLKIRNQGRGVLIENFRNHICQTLGIGPDASKDVRGIQLALPSNTTLYQSLVVGLKQVNDVGPEIPTQDPRRLIELASSTKLWIALSNNDAYTWPALFLRRDAHLVLLYDPGILVKNKRKQQTKAPVRQDFSFWSHVSHLKVHWLSLSHDPQALILFIEDLMKTDTQDITASLSEEQAADGTFNGLPVRVTKYKPTQNSKSHCIGDNWMWDASNHRSCHLQHLCFDTKEKSFVMFLPKSQENQQSALLPFDRSSTRVDTQTTKVMIGHSIRLGNTAAWFPAIRYVPLPTKEIDVYTFVDPRFVWLPYFPQQQNAANPGHLLWDYWLPFYNLLCLFHLEDRPLLLTNLDPYCVEDAADSRCYKVTTKFLPLLGVDPGTFINNKQSRLVLANDGASSSSLICAQDGVAGMGMLTDHGFKKHGQLLEDYKTVFNAGRGDFFMGFRNFMLQRMGIKSSSSSPPHKITFSVNSSNNPSRRRDFSKQIKAAKQLFPGDVVQSIVMGALSLAEQLSVMQESAIFISVMGGSASTAMFLKTDASLILYYNDIDDFVKGRNNEKMPNLMDWDFWNNASFLKVHWLSIKKMDEKQDLDVFSQLLSQLWSSKSNQ